MQNNNSSESDGIRLIKFLLKYRAILIIALVLSIAATLVATMLMEPEYESTGIIFPTPTNSPDRILNEPQFGYEVDADWLMQVLKSDIVRDTLNEVFNLVGYFQLDTSSPGWLDDFREKYQHMVSFERTRYMSIEITARTYDPEMSAHVVNTIIDKINGIRESIFKANTKQSLRHYERAYFEKMRYVNSLVDSIHNIRDYNTSRSLQMLYEQIKQKSGAIDSFRNELDEMRSEYDFYDLGMHLENLNMNLAESRSSYTTEKGKLKVYQSSLPEKDSLIVATKARIEGSLSNIEALETEIERFDTIKMRYDELTFKLRADLEQLNKLNAQYENTANAFEPFINSIRLERLASDYTHEQMILNELRQKYEDAIQNYENPIPSIYVINRAKPSYEKASPSLFKNGLIIILSTMVLVVGLLALLEKFKSIKKALNEPAG